MQKIECVAMLLAGGEGKRLSHLTKKIAKPAVPFGGKYRIIDFTLSNCCNSGIHTVGVLTQYQPMILNSYIGIGSSWDLDRKNGGVTVLPPYVEQTGGRWYKGTSHAIYQNMGYLDQYDAEYVLVISGDHIYKMNYADMLKRHKETNADASIAVIEIPIEESYRFGMMKVDEEDWIVEFQEKPKVTTSNTASMGVYIFNWKKLKAYLIADEEKRETNSDFGQDIIPAMLANHERLYAYRYKGYWKDVGTIDSLWEAHMDLLATDKPFRLHDPKWRIYTKNPNQPPQYIGATAKINRSLVNEGCMVFGEIDHSVLFYGVDVGEGSLIKDSIIMPQSKIGKNVTIHRAIIGWNTIIEDNARVGNPDESTEITLIGDNQIISESLQRSSEHE